MKGRIFRINRDRGFAHLRDETGASRFAHVTTFVNQIDFDFLYDGQEVEFNPDDNGPAGNKLRAIDVRVVRC